MVNDITYVQGNEVDKKKIPSRHFGIILTPEKWFKLAKQLESKKIKFHSTILFSPSAASFDKYKNFEERGKVFNELMKKYNLKN